MATEVLRNLESVGRVVWGRPALESSRRELQCVPVGKKCVVVVVKGTEGSGHTGNVFVDGLIKDIRPQCVKCLSFPPVFETLRVSNYARKNHGRQPRYVPKSENNFSRSTAMLLASLLSWH